MTSVSAVEKRRELEVKRVVQISKDAKLEHIEYLKEQHRRTQVEAKRKLGEERRKKEREIEQEERRLDEEKRRIEMQEQLEEMELAAEIRMLERESREEALRVEADAWAKFEELDMETAHKLETPLQRLDIEEILNKQPCKKGFVVGGQGRKSCVKIDTETEMPVKGEGIPSGMEPDFEKFRGGDPRMSSARKNDFYFGAKDDLVRELIASNVRIGLPKHEIECFSGDPTQYSIFKGSMQEINRSETLSYQEKLHYIYQYTRGEPRELVKAALYMTPRKGFQEIWNWYDEKYGAPEKIGAEFIDNLLSRPVV